jgi:hypothetical protein
MKKTEAKKSRATVPLKRWRGNLCLKEPENTPKVLVLSVHSHQFSNNIICRGLTESRETITLVGLSHESEMVYLHYLWIGLRKKL